VGGEEITEKQSPPSCGDPEPPLGTFALRVALLAESPREDSHIFLGSPDRVIRAAGSQQNSYSFHGPKSIQWRSQETQIRQSRQRALECKSPSAGKTQRLNSLQTRSRIKHLLSNLFILET
jgi:hypothetical protein